MGCEQWTMEFRQPSLTTPTMEKGMTAFCVNFQHIPIWVQVGDFLSSNK